MKRILSIKFGTIYSITHTNSGKCYVGSSVRYDNRWREHRRHLRQGRHHSITLQRAWNKYGAPAFVFKIVERCPISDLLVREQYWIDKSKSAFNMAPVAGTVFGIRFKRPKEFGQAIAERNRALPRKQRLRINAKIKATYAAKEYTQEMRDEISRKTRAAVSGKKIPKSARWIEQHRHRMLTAHTRPWLGRKHTEATKAKMRAAWVRRKNGNGTP